LSSSAGKPVCVTDEIQRTQDLQGFGEIDGGMDPGAAEESGTKDAAGRSSPLTRVM
jgi:hypothetical protein